MVSLDRGFTRRAGARRWPDRRTHSRAAGRACRPRGPPGSVSRSRVLGRAPRSSPHSGPHSTVPSAHHARVGSNLRDWVRSPRAANVRSPLAIHAGLIVLLSPHTREVAGFEAGLDRRAPRQPGAPIRAHPRAEGGGTDHAGRRAGSSLAVRAATCAGEPIPNEPRKKLPHPAASKVMEA